MKMVLTYVELVEENEELRGAIRKLRTQYETLKKKANIVSPSGWKGKSGLKITKAGNEWIVVEWQKEKEDHAVEEITNRVPAANVNTCWALIKKLCPKPNMIVRYRTLVPEIIKHYGWTDVTVDSFNGGKKRRKYYFGTYYYPVKILEEKGYVKYSGRGVITRIK